MFCPELGKLIATSVKTVLKYTTFNFEIPNHLKKFIICFSSIVSKEANETFQHACERNLSGISSLYVQKKKNQPTKNIIFTDVRY
jgi:hypothetical protein